MSTVARQLSLRVCYVCGLVREHEKSPEDVHGDGEAWLNVSSYLERHGFRGMDCKLTHTCCPVCFQRYALSGTASDDESQSTTHRVQPISRLILRTIGYNHGCSLEALMQACLPFTWNQILLEMDRLSRSGEIQLSLSGRGRYTLKQSRRRENLTPDKPSHAGAVPDTAFPTRCNSV